MTPVQYGALDRAADRLSALYVHASEMLPAECAQPRNWTYLLHEIVAITALIERTSNRSYREKNAA
jgi:hypothetical protein